MTDDQATIAASPTTSKRVQGVESSGSLGSHGTRVAGIVASVLIWVGATTILGPRATAADGDANGRGQSALLIWAPAGNGEAGPLVFLDRPQRPKDAPAPVPGPSVIGSSGLMVRELARQAALIAARDGCNARTRDAVLGEVGGAGKPTISLVLEWDLPLGPERSVTLRTEAGEVLWSMPPAQASLAGVLQEQAQGPLRDALVKAGLKRVELPKDVVKAIPQEIDEALGRMTWIAQFAAVRGLHDELKLHGPSPVLLGALARGYAGLSVLTEHHWHPAHKVFKARALMYGQQAAAADVKGPIGLRSLAYAEALVGRQRDSLRHLTEADRRAGAAEKPAWVERIRLFCNDEFAKLTEGDAAKDPLARLLVYLVAEGGSGVYEDYTDPPRSRLLLAASEVLLLETDCFRVHDAACRFSGVALLHQATTAGPRLFETSIASSVGTVPGAPADLGDDIPKTLEQAARGRDRREPSLAVLGMLIREARFVMVWRRVDFIRFKLDAPGADDPPYDPALIGDHPLRPFLDAHARGFNRPEFKALAGRLIDEDIELTAVPLIDRVRQVDGGLGNRLFNRAMDHGDELSRDLAEEIRFGPNAVAIGLAPRLLAVRPNSPVARAAFAEYDPNLDPQLAAQWEKDPTAGPEVLGALGRRYVAAKQWEDAQRCLAASIAASPDRWAFRALASAYKAQGKLDKWKETLELFLKEEDYGLDHAMVRNEIARELMSTNHTREALKYAEDAAQSGAAWAMLTASSCREQLGDWTESEQWVRAVSERYVENAADWFWWCKRTGRGDAKAALALLKPQLPALSRAVSDPGRVFNFGNVLIVAGEPRLALELSKRFNDQSYNLGLAIRVATLADQVDDAKLRDQTLARIAADTGPEGASSKKVLAVVRDWLARPDADTVGPDLAKFDAILAEMPVSRGNISYILSQFLDHHGRKDEATSYLSLSAAAKPPEMIDERFHILARSALRDRGLDPDKVKPRPLPAAGQNR